MVSVEKGRRGGVCLQRGPCLDRIRLQAVPVSRTVPRCWAGFKCGQERIGAGFPSLAQVIGL